MSVMIAPVCPVLLDILERRSPGGLKLPVSRTYADATTGSLAFPLDAREVVPLG